MEKGFHHPDRGYWQTLSDPDQKLRDSYPEGTIETPLKPGDHYGWIDGKWAHTPPPPPTVEEIREAMPPLSQRRFRLGLIRAGRSPAEVDKAIAAIGDPAEREAARVEWEYASGFERLHPLVASLAAALGLAPEEVDGMWERALTL